MMSSSTIRFEGIRGVVFDLDGTLIDSYSAHIDAWVRTARSFGVEADEEDVKPHLGRSSEDIARALLGAVGDERVREAYQLKDRIYYELIPVLVRSVPGARRTLAELKKRGYLICIASSNPARVIERSLQSTGLWSSVDEVASQDEVERGKPEPDLFLLGAKKLGLELHICLGVGDTSYDVLSARGAGMRTAAFSGGVQSEEELRKAEPDVVIGDLTNLLDLLPERSG